MAGNLKQKQSIQKKLILWTITDKDNTIKEIHAVYTDGNVIIARAMLRPKEMQKKGK